MDQSKPRFSSLYHLIQILIGFFAAAILSALSLDAQVKVTGQPDRIEALTPHYALTVERHPYRLLIERRVPGRQVVLASPEGSAAAAYLSVAGSTLPLDDVRSFSVKGNELELKISAPGRQGTATEHLRLLSDRIEVSAKAEGFSRIERFGANFSLASAGHWFGGDVTAAYRWPLETGEWSADPLMATSNQVSPFWMTSSGAGIFVDTYEAIAVSINQKKDGLFRFTYLHSPSMHYTIFIGNNIAQVRDLFANAVGKPRHHPPDYLFERPIWCTWSEHFGKETQAKVLEYAHHIHDEGWPASVIVIDDGWATHYGDFVFKPAFTDPKAMVDEIHGLGYKLSLWVVNFVAPDSHHFKTDIAKGYLLRHAATGKPAMIRWWNGESGLVDLGNPAARAAYTDDLRRLMAKYGVDGFKFDGGDAEYWPPAGAVSAGGPLARNRYTDLFVEVASEFELNELRVGWRSQPLGVFNRMRDKSSSWSEVDGLPAIITQGSIQSLLGFVFDGPDLIGGGLDEGFRPNEELTVRWTEAAAFMPVMQFSYGPWKFTAASQKIMKDFVALHAKLWPTHFKPLIERAMRTGKPIWSPLFYVFPVDEQSFLTKDEFMLGNSLLVAPVVRPGARERDVYLPSGEWRDYWTGKSLKGGRTVAHVPAPLERIPVFEKIASGRK